MGTPDLSGSIVAKSQFCRLKSAFLAKDSGYGFLCESVDQTPPRTRPWSDLMTVVLSAMSIFQAIAQLRTWQDDARSGASIVALLLGVLLADGGGCLVVRGSKYQGRAV